MCFFFELKKKIKEEIVVNLRKKMELVDNIVPNDVSTIFFNKPSHLIEALIWGSQREALSLDLHVAGGESGQLTGMIDLAKTREGLRSDGSYLDNIFTEIHYRLLEKKNSYLLAIQETLPGMTDESIHRYLHQVCLDEVNQESLYFLFKFSIGRFVIKKSFF